MREMPDRVVGWCDYNSFFASQEIAERWQREHPEIKGITRSPEQMSHLITELLGRGRLDYSYQPDFPLIPLARNLHRFGLVGLTRDRIPRPDTFWLPTPGMIRRWKQNGLGMFFRFHLR
nr:organomercurial lyase [Nocardia yunnanensis]